jgi:hypothetical protein
VQASPSRPGNARGNALSTNEAAAAELQLAAFSWQDEGATVSVAVPLRLPAARCSGRQKGTPLLVETVSAAFSQAAFDLRVQDESGKTHRLCVRELPHGGLKPQARGGLASTDCPLSTHFANRPSERRRLPPPGVPPSRGEPRRASGAAHAGQGPA